MRKAKIQVYDPDGEARSHDHEISGESLRVILNHALQRLTVLRDNDHLTSTEQEAIDFILDMKLKHREYM